LTPNPLFPDQIIALDRFGFVWEQPMDIFWVYGDLQLLAFYE